jgi:integral membrane protein
MAAVFSHPPLPTSPEERASLKRRLNLIAVIAIVDAVLLVVLVWASLSDNEGAVHVLGPIHGVGFLVLLYLCITGAGEERWGWWFPLIVLLTGGPVGSLIGDWIVRRRLAAA